MNFKYLYLISVFTLCNTAIACDKKVYPVKQAFSKSDYVFAGEVTNLRYLDAITQTKLEPRIIVTFSVQKIWKGKKQQQITIHTTHNKGSCNGFVFKSGEKYLVYAVTQKRKDLFIVNLFTGKQPTIGVKLYGGTKKLTDAKKDLLYLNKI